ncbi:MAG TPA: response regulator [Gammaproteobacteria bacterium]|nr:response regulator [Gammaproteobacteria bacterium]
MTSKQKIFLARRKYNQWVANETLEDFALRYTAKRARKWSNARIANTALGIVSFLALEAIGGAITLQYGFTNSMWAIFVVCALIFLTGLPICYHAAKSGLDIDLLTRGAGFGYIGSTISSLIYASFTFIFFALEAAIMSMALQLLFDIPLVWAYVISALAVIPLVTHGITRISRFQLWTQPVWLILQIAPLLFVLYHQADAISAWTQFTGSTENRTEDFDLLLFGAAAAVIFPLIAQNGEQVDFLRFLPKENENSRKWWLSIVFAGPGWTLVGVIKLLIGSFLAVFALQHGVSAELADDPTHMYLVAFNYITQNPDIAIVLVGTFVIISQLKINVTNAYAGSLAWSNFFSRLTHDHPGRIVWLFFNVAIALLLMELGLYQTFETILITYSALVLAWIGSLVADLVINKPLKLRPQDMEFKRGHLYDINPVGVVSMLIASILGICTQLGLFGLAFKALSPFIALFTPFITAPLIAYVTRGRYYLARKAVTDTHNAIDEIPCKICENAFDKEDMTHCPAYEGTICSLCCALDSGCHDRCRSEATFKAQTQHVLSKIFPEYIVRKTHSVVGHFLIILFLTSTLIATLLAFVYAPLDPLSADPQGIVKKVLWQSFFLLFILAGVLVWLYVLAESSKRKAYAELQKQNDLLSSEVKAHEATSRELQSAKNAAVTANQAKSRYLSGVSHELRTPLNTIFGYAQILESEKTASSKNRQSASAIRRNSEHLADVIEGLLEISKIEARHLDLHRDQVKIAPLLKQITEMFSLRARAKKIKFDYQCLSDLPEFVIVDEKRLRQILMNLMSNAVKFTSKGKVTFQINYRNEVATFTIIDTGVGIKTKDQERIFEPFERIRDTQTNLVGGTGLGLSISRLLCHLMGGDLSVHSKYGQGTRFEFRLMMPAVHNVEVKPMTPQAINGFQESEKTILAVDDEPCHRNLLVDLLSPLGFKVLTAHDAESALYMASNHSIDLFLLDVSLPTRDGWELAAELKNRYQNKPIIMLSANAIETHRTELNIQLHDDYLIKPLHLSRLLEKVGRVLGLNWIYDKPEPPLTHKTASNQDTLPSQTELDELVAMAQIGYLSGVLERLELLTIKYENSGFLKYLKSLAVLCDLEGLIQTIKGLGKS